MECTFKLPVYPIEFSKRVVIIRDQESTDILSVPKKYADYIVQAINSHEKLVEALGNLREELDEDHIHDREDCTGDCPICVIDEALKEAEKP